MDHQHKQGLYFANGKLVCSECISKDDENKNECFCICHNENNLQCPQCERFHR